MKKRPVTLEELYSLTPTVLKEMMTEFVRRSVECRKVDAESQQTACLLLAVRSVSLLCGMGLLLRPTTLDSYEVLNRAFLESRDLLMTFRFNDRQAREKVGYWFQGKYDRSWKADHQKCEEFLHRRGASQLELRTRWSMVTTLSHPTKYAAENSAVGLDICITGRAKAEDLSDSMMIKRADYLLSIARLIMAVTFDLKGWAPLGCDPHRMPTVEPFRENAEIIALPLVNRPQKHGLPVGSYRSKK